MTQGEPSAKPPPTNALILLRATSLTERIAAFANQLAAQSDLPLALLLDARHPVTTETPHPQVLLSRQACEALGLYCPLDFAWRCGDYGLYLARQRFPDVTNFWVIEHDVRFAGGVLGDFFRFFEHRSTVDFLAANVRAAERDWDWYAYARGRGVRPYRCFFPVVRLAASALDVLLEKRRSQSRSPQRRKAWPNDESFVATTLFNAGFDVRDLNAFGKVFYTPETHTATRGINGDAFSPIGPELRIYHPVLFGEDFTRGNLSTQIARVDGVEQLKRRVRRFRNGLLAW